MNRTTSTPTPPPTYLNIASSCLAQNASQRGEKTALLFVHEKGTLRYTFAQAHSIVMQLAQQLQSNETSPGDRVLLWLPNSPLFAFSFLAALAAGLIAVPLSPQLTAAEVQFLLEDTGARLLCVTDKRLSPGQMPDDCALLDLSEWSQKGWDDAHRHPQISPLNTMAKTPAYLVYTSGTTGQPKGVLHGHRSLWGRRPMHEGWTGIEEADLVLHAGQLNWTYTMGVGLLDPWAVGATAMLVDGTKDPTSWPDLIDTHQVTIFAAVPSLYRQILKYTPSLSGRCRSLRHGLTAGEALSPELHQQWLQTVGVPLYEALGMSECSTYISSGPQTPVRPGSPGRPQSGRRIAILPREGGTTPLPSGQVGLLGIHRSDPGLMLGYWKRPEEEEAVYRGEWFVGGDLAHLDADGYVWFHGRADEVMNAFGYRVSPREVERALEDHPAIREVAVTALHVRKDVSIIAAFVVAHDPDFRDQQALLRWCKAHLATYKIPKEFRFVSELPRTPSGKLKRQALQDHPFF